MPKKGVQTISNKQLELIFFMIRSTDELNSSTSRKLEEIIKELKND